MVVVVVELRTEGRLADERRQVVGARYGGGFAQGTERAASPVRRNKLACQAQVRAAATIGRSLAAGRLSLGSVWPHYLSATLHCCIHWASAQSGRRLRPLGKCVCKKSEDVECVTLWSASADAARSAGDHWPAIRPEPEL